MWIYSAKKKQLNANQLGKYWIYSAKKTYP